MMTRMLAMVAVVAVAAALPCALISSFRHGSSSVSHYPPLSVSYSDVMDYDTKL